MVEKADVRRGYDALGEAYVSQRTQDLTAEDWPSSFPSGSRVLDAGCGPGRPVLTSLCETSDPIGLDFSREQLRLAAAAVPEVPLVQGDLGTLPFTDGTFDVVIALWSLIHVPAAEHRHVIEEFARVLAPGGEVILNEGIEEWSGTNPDWLDSGVAMEWHLAGASTTREQLEGAGFVVETEWRGADTLAEDDDESPWAFFRARLAA